MKIDALKLLDGTTTVEVDESVQVLQSEDDPSFRFLEGMTGTLAFSRMHDGKVLVRGTLRTRVQADCVRCLDPVEQPLVAEVMLVYVHDAALLDPVRRYDFPDEVAYYNGHVIEPLDDLRDLLLLDLPAYPSCDLIAGRKCRMPAPESAPLVFGSPAPEEESSPPASRRSDASGAPEDWKTALRRASESKHPPKGA